MGNQMFQYAFGRALAAHNSTALGLDISFFDNPGLPVRTYDLDLFSIEARILTTREIPLIYRPYGTGVLGRTVRKIIKRIVPNIGKESSFVFDAQKLSVGVDTYVDGYWQSYKYFESIEDTIRKDFTLVQQLPEHIQKLKEEILSMNSVCLHVRRGDYVGNAFHEVVGPSYYERALEVLKEKIAIEHLYVFSDDIAWCKESLTFGYPTTYVGEEYAGARATGHFELMRACRHFIIPNSSFSWWAAWLAKAPHKVVIAPKQWFIDDTIGTTDLLPHEWIAI